MQNRRTVLLYLFTLPLFIACTTPVIPDKEKEKPKAPKHAKDEKNCLEQGGKWMKAGLLDHPMCIFKASDAGKACTDSKQCEYRCYAHTPILPGSEKKTTGSCQATSNPFGCNSVVKDGIAQPVLCVD